jgi:hypothetical protein
MGSLDRRLRLLEQRTVQHDICAEHLERRPWRERFFESLALFSPDPAERAVAEAKQEVEASRPPCSRCGWRPDVILIKADPDWGQHGSIA